MAGHVHAPVLALRRPSACADASQRAFEARFADVPPEQRARDLAEFNRQLAAVIAAGRFTK